MSMLAFLAILAACVTVIALAVIVTRAATQSGREEALSRQVTKWSDDIKGRLVDVEVSMSQLRDDWRKWKAGK